LRSLVAAGVLERHRYSEHPPRDEYVLTEAGKELNPVILSLMRWGDRYLAGENGPPLVLEHRCGHRLQPEVTCAACGEPVRYGDSRRIRAAEASPAPSLA
jgi:hypothetical protein